MPKPHAGRTYLITGASSGIGRSVALYLSQEGAKLVLHGRNLERLEETRSLLDWPEAHRVVSADVSDMASFTKALDTLKLPDLGINGIVHAAGVTSTLPLRAIRKEHFLHVMEVNAWSGMALAQWFARKVGKISLEDASMVMVSSVMGHVGDVAKSTYAASKGAVEAIVRSLALELAPKRIRVNAVAPGVVQSPMIAGATYAQEEAKWNEMKSRHPLGIGTPQDVASACAFLLSPESRWITGTTLVVDGGYLAR